MKFQGPGSTSLIHDLENALLLLWCYSENSGKHLGYLWKTDSDSVQVGNLRETPEPVGRNWEESQLKLFANSIRIIYLMIFSMPKLPAKNCFCFLSLKFLSILQLLPIASPFSLNSTGLIFLNSHSLHTVCTPNKTKSTRLLICSYVLPVVINKWYFNFLFDFPWVSIEVSVYASLCSFTFPFLFAKVSGLLLVIPLCSSLDCQTFLVFRFSKSFSCVRPTSISQLFLSAS